MKALSLHPLFFVGAAIRLGLVLALAPVAMNDWYAPFMQASASRLDFDPWSGWLAAGGDPLAFPYGYVMWLTFLPSAWLAEALVLPAQYGYWLTLVAVDVGLLYSLHRLVPGMPTHRLLTWYWLSPLVLLATYGLGLNDLVPILLLTLALVLMRQPVTKAQSACAGAVCALAVSAKLSMVVSIPFFLIYLHNGKLLRSHLPAFLAGLSLSTLCVIGPSLLSPSNMHMLWENPQMQNIYQLMFGLNNGLSFYIVPTLYILTLYSVWTIGRINFDLFLTGTGVSFLLVTLFAATSPGWFIWNMPFLMFCLFIGSRSTRLLVGVFVVFYLLSISVSTPFHLADGSRFDISVLVPERLPSLLHTAFIVAGVVLAAHTWRHLITRNDFYRLSRKPFLFGIAGDSGSGKSTLADALTKLLGTHSVVEVSGDNYHLWDRRGGMWKVLTHLNPAANDLSRLGNDLVTMAKRAPISSPQYDHAIGKLREAATVPSNDFIIVTGLHAFYLSTLRRLYDLRIYLDMDEPLRRYFKHMRDTEQRGYSAQAVADNQRRREEDAQRFVRPQRAHADLIFSLQPTQPEALSRLAPTPPRLMLKVCATRTVHDSSLIHALIGLCNLHVNTTPDDDKMHMAIEGEVSAPDIALVAELTCSRVLDLLDTRPQWQDGVTGLMQVIVLCHIDHALTGRVI